jgi:hypothetical protein
MGGPANWRAVANSGSRLLMSTSSLSPGLGLAIAIVVYGYALKPALRLPRAIMVSWPLCWTLALVFWATFCILTHSNASSGLRHLIVRFRRSLLWAAKAGVFITNRYVAQHNS